MSPQPTNILILDDEKDIRREVNEFLTSLDFIVKEAARPSEAFSILADHPIDIAILDIRLPEKNGIDVLKLMRKKHPLTQVIMMSGHGDMSSVIQALRLGAVDYFQKPFQLHEMLKAIEKSQKFITTILPHNGDHFNAHIQNSLTNWTSNILISESELMKAVTEKMRLVARTKDTTVLITGESGTGKELIARGIHNMSSRRDKPFHAVNCSSIPDELFESEFFGYKRGAFTGANTDKSGWFEAAAGGTLFLDEIGDLKINLQSKLLRIIEDKQVSRLGDTSPRKIDMRILAATNQDLEKLIKENLFRQDLYHRLNTFIIHVPPLRERKGSIPTLFAYYLDYYCKKLEREVPKIEKRVLNNLMKYDFPGNVRELKNIIERALILCEGDELTIDHFDHLNIKMTPTSPESPPSFSSNNLGDFEKNHIESVLAETGYNKSQAARLLNISRQALDRKIVKMGILLKS